MKLQCACRNDVVYGLVREGKVRRITFSRAIALFVQSKNPDHEIWMLDVVIGDEATPASTNCIFGIVSRKKGKLLRAAITYDEAAFLCQDPSRYVAECKVRRTEKYANQLLHPRERERRSA